MTKLRSNKSQPGRSPGGASRVALPEAIAAFKAGDHAQAAALCREILKRQPGNADAMGFYAVVLFQSGRQDRAIELMRSAVARNPASAEAQHNLAYALHQSGRLDEAIPCYEKAVAQAPAFSQALHNLADCHGERGDDEQAMNYYRRALAIQPSALTCNNLGNLLKRLGQAAQAIAYYERALALQPNYDLPLNNLGLLYFEQGDADRAIRSYRQALALRRSDKVLNNLALALGAANALDEALPCHLEAWSLNKNHLAALGSAISVKQQVCDWQEPFSSMVEQLLATFEQPSPHPVSPFCFLSIAETSPSQQLRCATAFCTNYKVAPSYRHVPPGSAPQRLRIGYLSSDYHTHATTSLIAELFALHDRANFEIIAYSTGADDGGPMRQHMARTADRFVDLRAVPDRAAAQRIYQDGIHVLVDLKGHTQDARTPIMLARPAPVQVNWLGYPGSMGSSCFDYIFTDEFITPAGHESWFAERIVRLPGCYQINDRNRGVAESLTRFDYQLPADAFVFCSFNQTYKITPALFDIWMTLLRQVPGSVLWLLESNRWAAANLRREALARGVEPARLIFAPKVGRAEHLARYRAADLCLDTYPVTSHTTASDALWVGCPLVTCAGESFVSRVAGSLLTSVGRADLITYSLDDYGKLALSLAQQPQRLRSMRTHLVDNRDRFPLFDSRLFVKNLEIAFRDVWNAWRSGASATAA